MNEQADYIPTLTVNDEDREIIIRAIEAARHQPRLIDGTWWIWDFDKRTYIDTKGVASFEESTILNTKLEDIIARLETVEAFAAAANDRYLRKDVEDVAGDVETFAKGALSDSFRSRYYAPGLAGAGFSLTHDESGSHLEVDYATFRKKAYFYELVIQQISHQGGIMFFTPARMECSEVEITPNGFKCHFDTKSGTVSNDFVVGDQARCQRFDLGMTTAKYYWRLVTEVGKDYIVLSLTDADNGSDQPTSGDLIVQFGNRDNPMRQAAKVTTAIGENAPRDEYYEGIDSYDLTGKLITAVGVVDGKVGVFTENGSFSGSVVIGANSTGLENLAEWHDKESKINEAYQTASDAAVIARNAAEATKRVESLMAEIDDDAVLTLSEKRTLRTEWETINGAASLSSVGDTGSYMGTRKLIEDLGYTAGEEVILSYGDAVLTYNGIKIVFNSSGISEFNLAFEELRERLVELHLYSDESTYNFNRQIVAKALTTYYDAQSRILTLAQSGYSEGLAAKASQLAVGAQEAADTAGKLAVSAEKAALEASEDASNAQKTADAAAQAASKASDAAGKAQETANSANTKLNDWASDAVISPFEKQGISDERVFVVADKADIDNQKAKYAIENEETLYNAYLGAYNAYVADLDTIMATPGACPVPDGMSAHQDSFYQARTAILNAISAAALKVANDAQNSADAAKSAAGAAKEAAGAAQKYAESLNDILTAVKNTTETLKTTKVGSEEYNQAMTTLNDLVSKAKQAADTAQKTADAAAQAASKASDAAGKAQETANSANTKLNDWASDAVISPFEKQGISDERVFVVADKADIDNQKAKYAIENEETLYNAYLGAYNAYVADLDTIMATPGACPVPDGMSAHQDSFYQARTAILNAISAAALKVANDAQNSADKAKDVADSATKLANGAQTSADNAMDRADEAYQYSEKIAGLLSNIDDDTILTVSEKSSIRNEWEKINGSASFSYSGSSGSYPNAVSIANKLEVNMTGKVMLSMNGKVISYNDKILLFNNSGFAELELAFEDLREYLVSLNLYNNEICHNFDRRTLASKLSIYYSAEEIFLSNAQKLYTDEKNSLLKSDISALAESLAKDVGYSSWDDMVSAANAGKTIMSGGFLNTVILKAEAILAEHIAAGAITAAKIAAGAISAEKIASGAITSEKISAGAITAEKIDTDDLFAQHLEADDMKLKSGCQVGDMSIGKYVTACGKEDDIDSVYSKKTSIADGVTYTEGARLSAGGLTVTGEALTDTSCLLSNSFSVDASRNPLSSESPIVSIRGYSRPAFKAVGKSIFENWSDDGIAIEIESGVLSGINLYAYIAQSKTTYIWNDTPYGINTIIAKYTGGEQTIYLPELAEIGTWIRVINPYERGTQKITINGNGKQIEQKNGPDSIIWTTSRSVMEFIYDGIIWHATYNPD